MRGDEMPLWSPGMLLGFLLSLLNPQEPPEEQPVIPEIPPAPAPTPAPPPAPHKFDPQKDFPKPALWKYYPDASYDILIAKNYKDYIIPYNELVEYFIDHIKFEEFTETVGKGTPWETSSLYINIKWKYDDTNVYFNYQVDTSRLCREAGQDNRGCYEQFDFWQNPDRYIWNNLEGDCEEYALLFASVFEKLDIPYMVVSGYINGVQRDWWIEFIYNGKPYLGQVNRYVGMPGAVDHATYRPYMMFNKSTDIQPYREWYKDPELNRTGSNVIVI